MLLISHFYGRWSQTSLARLHQIKFWPSKDWKGIELVLGWDKPRFDEHGPETYSFRSGENSNDKKSSNQGPLWVGRGHSCQMRPWSQPKCRVPDKHWRLVNCCSLLQDYRRSTKMRVQSINLLSCKDNNWVLGEDRIYFRRHWNDYETSHRRW